VAIEATLVALAVLVVWAVLVALVVWLVLAGRAVLVVLAEWVVLAAATAPQLFPLAAEVPETGGNTIPSIAAELRIGTGRPPTGSGERRGVIRSPIVSLALGNKSVGRAAICRVPAGEELAQVIARAEVWAIGRAEAGQTALEAATSRAAAAGTAMLSEEDPGAPRDTTDRALAPAAAAALPVWDLEGEA
jgi:hypothetical protein